MLFLLCLFPHVFGTPSTTVQSKSKDWLNIAYDAPPYAYGPALVFHNNMYYNFYCSPGCYCPDNGWDNIRLTTSTNLIDWSAPSVALKSDTDTRFPDWSSVCDPAVVQLHGVWFMYYTCINEKSPDAYINNRICVALSDNVEGPYHKYHTAVIEDVSCGKDMQAYCVGQPAATIVNGTVYVFYTNTHVGMPGPNPGVILLATSTDGITFSYRNTIKDPCYIQRDVDVKYDRVSKRFLMIQGDVGGPNITWATSVDGLKFDAYDPSSRRIETNTGMIPGGTNNNPGLTALPDGTLGGGQTAGIYGSTYSADQDSWHLFRSDIIIQPNMSDCSQCVSISCDYGCAQAMGGNAIGRCAYPGSQDPTKCCECSLYPSDKDCRICAPEGCNVGCIGAGFSAGVCANPGSSDPSNCCGCIH